MWNNQSKQYEKDLEKVRWEATRLPMCVQTWTQSWSDIDCWEPVCKRGLLVFLPLPHLKWIFSFFPTSLWLPFEFFQFFQIKNWNYTHLYWSPKRYSKSVTYLKNCLAIFYGKKPNCETILPWEDQERSSNIWK